MGVETLKVKLSGGSANADPALSTGGAMSSTVVLSQVATFVPIAGITVVDAAGNAVGTGTLTYTAASKTLTWAPPGDIAGIAASIGANGTYLVRGANLTSGYLVVSVVSANLPASTNYTRAVTITNQSALFLPAVSKDTAFAGATQYFLYYLDNTGISTIKSISVMIAADTPGLDTLSIAAIPTKNTIESAAAAAGHTYSLPGNNVAMGDLLAGDFWGFWIKREIPSGTINGVTSNTFKLQFTTLT